MLKSPTKLTRCYPFALVVKKKILMEISILFFLTLPLDIFKRFPKTQNCFFLNYHPAQQKPFFLKPKTKVCLIVCKKSAIASKSSLHLVFFWKN